MQSCLMRFCVVDAESRRPTPVSNMKVRVRVGVPPHPDLDRRSRKSSSCALERKCVVYERCIIIFGVVSIGRLSGVVCPH